MVTSCFFCQNLLSDFIEGILPSSRHEQLKGHLAECKECSAIHRDLQTSLKALHTLPARVLTPDLSMRIGEASQAGSSGFLSRRNLSRVTLLVVFPLLVFFSVAAIFPGLFPWLPLFKGNESENQFVRYFPLLQGASEILEEQGTWLHSRESLMGSLWEEGGLSPEEFEKTFQVKPPKGDAIEPVEGL